MAQIFYMHKLRFAIAVAIRILYLMDKFLRMGSNLVGVVFEFTEYFATHIFLRAIRKGLVR